MRGRWMIIAGAALAGIAPACGSSTDTSGKGGAGGGGLSGDGCGQLAQASCDKLAQCAGPLVQQLYTDTSSCVSRLEPLCTLAMQAPGVNVTDAELADCAQRYAALSCNDYAASDICTFAPGSFANGAACGNNLQCQSGYCSTTSGSDCGTCASRVPDGGSCAGNAAGCEAGSACTVQTNVCAKLVPAGGACGDAACEPSTTCIDGTCQSWLEKGATCDNQTALFGGCDLRQALYCDATTSTCTPWTFAAAGDPCGDINGAYVICGHGATCVISGSGGTTGTCIAPLADGASCGGTMPSNCTAPAECVDGVCKYPDPSQCK